MKLIRKITLYFCLVLFANNARAIIQDTNYYRKYNDRFIVAFYQSVRKYDITFDQLIATDTTRNSSHQYRADADLATGIELNFDKLSFSFTYKTTPPDSRTKGTTTYSDLGFSFGDNEMIVESNYRRYKGFYDFKSSSFDTANFKKSGIFYQNPSMKVEGFRSKLIYFLNPKKFSYKSAYSCSYRQLKSAISGIMIGDVYYNRMSTDTAFISPRGREYYGDLKYLNGLYTTGLAMKWGLSFNIVIFKRFFANLTGAAGAEAQWRNYRYSDSPKSNRTYLAFAADVRGSLGYNGKNLFITVSNKNDISIYDSGQMKIRSTFNSGAFTIGYRFKVRQREWMKKAKDTTLYRLL